MPLEPGQSNVQVSASNPATGNFALGYTIPYNKVDEPGHRSWTMQDGPEYNSVSTQRQIHVYYHPTTHAIISVSHCWMVGAGLGGNSVNGFTYADGAGVSDPSKVVYSNGEIIFNGLVLAGFGAAYSGQASTLTGKIG